MAASVIEGEKTYKASCGRCHGLKDPASYTAKEWEPIMKSMAPKAKLSEQETSNVMAFVVNNAKKSLGF
jgi:mono/diheme cytochrome c family protein